MSAVKHNPGLTGANLGPGPQGYGRSSYPRDNSPVWERTPWWAIWRPKWRKSRFYAPYESDRGPYDYASDRELARIHLEERYGEKDQGTATQARFGRDTGPYQAARIEGTDYPR